MQAGRQAGRQPCRQAARQPGSQATRQPGSQAARQSGNQATRQPGSQAVSQSVVQELVSVPICMYRACMRVHACCVAVIVTVTVPAYPRMTCSKFAT